MLPAGQVLVENVTCRGAAGRPPSARSSRPGPGRVVASEVQEFVGPGGTSGGLSLVPGVPAPQSHWTIPQAQEVPGGSSRDRRLQPRHATEAVTVRFRLPSGPLAPLTDKVLPGTTWASPRAHRPGSPTARPTPPPSTPPGGPGVVVGRTVSLPGGHAAAAGGHGAGRGRPEHRSRPAASGSCRRRARAPARP